MEALERKRARERPRSRKANNEKRGSTKGERGEKVALWKSGKLVGEDERKTPRPRAVETEREDCASPGDGGADAGWNKGRFTLSIPDGGTAELTVTVPVASLQ